MNKTPKIIIAETSRMRAENTFMKRFRLGHFIKTQCFHFPDFLTLNSKSEPFRIK